MAAATVPPRSRAIGAARWPLAPPVFFISCYKEREGKGTPTPIHCSCSVDACVRETDRPTCVRRKKQAAAKAGYQREEMAPLKLYGMPVSPNVVRVATVLNEKGLDFEIIPVDLTTGAHKQPDFLALNPFAQIPALVDGDEVLYESRAINRYIATKFASSGAALLPATPSAKLEVWLEVESHHFYPNASPLVFQLLFRPLFGGPPDPVVVDKHAHELAKVLDVYEAHLASNKYLAGDQFTLADANHASYLLYLTKTPKAGLVNDRPHVKAWWEGIAARPAFQKTAAAIPLPPPPSA